MASPTPRRQPDPASGLSFTPGDAVLVCVYLPRKIAGQELPDGVAMFLHDADVYAAEPAVLVAEFLPAVSAFGSGENKDWYFFTYVKANSRSGRRRDRTVGGCQGFWLSRTTKKDVLDGEGYIVGYKQCFTYKPSNAERSANQWLMAEYSLDREDEAGKPVPVLCKIYQKHPSAPSSWLLAPKRKATPTDELTDLATSSPARRRLLFTPSPPASTPPPTRGATTSEEAPTSNFSFLDFLASDVLEAGDEQQGEMDYSCFMDDLASSVLSESGTAILGGGCIPRYAEKSDPWIGDPSLCS